MTIPYEYNYATNTIHNILRRRIFVKNICTFGKQFHRDYIYESSNTYSKYEGPVNLSTNDLVAAVSQKSKLHL